MKNETICIEKLPSVDTIQTYMSITDEKIILYVSDVLDGQRQCATFTRDSIEYDKKDLNLFYLSLHKAISFADEDEEKMEQKLTNKIHEFYPYYVNRVHNIICDFRYDACRFIHAVLYGIFDNAIKMEMESIEVEHYGGYLDHYNGKECVRCFCRFFDKLGEFLRILIEDDGSYSFYRNVSIGWVKTLDDGLSSNHLRIPLNGEKPKYYSHCETVLELCLSLMYKGWNNIISMDQHWLVDSYVGLGENQLLWMSVSDIFGEVFDFAGRSFSKMSGLSQYVVDEMVNSNDKEYSRFIFFVAKTLTNVLYDIETDTNFFRSVDKESFSKLIEYILKYSEKYNYNYLSQKINLVNGVMEGYEPLIKHYGKENWLDKLLYCIDIPDSRWYEYIDLIYMSSALGIREWKVDYDHIEEVHDEVTLLYDYQEDEDLCNKMQEGFTKQQKNWRDYTFSYGDLSIVIPKEPRELITEGITLKHCVKSYIESTANGKTCILFIRKTDELDKPYFTMEIRGDAIRQCHGKCNCDMTDEVDEFVSKFCEEKGITPPVNNAILAV